MTNPPTPPYTEATRQLVLAALREVPAGRWHASEIAEGVLNALVKAGLLLPEGAGTEWGVEVIPPDRRYQGYRVVAESEEVARGMVAGRDDWKLQCRRASDWVYAE